MNAELVGAYASLITAAAALLSAVLTILWKWHNQQVKDLIAQRDGALVREDAAVGLAQRNQAGFEVALQLLEKQQSRRRRYGDAD